MIAVKKQRFRASNFSKRQPHLVPPGISVRGFLGHAFIDKAEFRVVRKESVLAGQHKSLAALLSGIGDGTADQLTGIAAFAVLRQGIDAENHLPYTVFVVHTGVFVHFIGQIRLVRDKTVHKRNQLVGIVQQPEVVAVILDPLDKFLFGCRFGRWKAGGFCHGDGSNVFFFCIGDLLSVFLLNG